MKHTGSESQGVRRRTVLAGAAIPWAIAPALAASGSLDATRFFGQEETLSAHMSPDGRRIALRTVARHGGVMLSVLDLASMVPVVLHSQESADACQVMWASHERLLFSIEERRLPQGRVDSGPGLFAINADGTAFRQLVERQEIVKFEKMESNGISGAVPTGTAPKGVGAAAAGQEGMGFKQVADAPNVKNVREVDSDTVLPWNTFVLSARQSTATDVIWVWQPKGTRQGVLEVSQLSLRTGRIKAVDLPGSLLSVHVDGTGDVRCAVVLESGRPTTLWRDPTSRSWRALPDCTPEAETDWAIKHVDSRGRLYISARRSQDKLALWVYSVDTARWSDAPVAQSPLFDVDAAVILANDMVVGYRFDIDAEVTQWIDPALQALQQQIDKALPRTVNRLTLPAVAPSPWVLIEAFADIQPTLFLLFHRETRKFARLGSTRPDVASKDQASMDLTRIKARDGLEVPVWLTLPPGIGKKNLPMVVWLHDGPFSRMPTWRWSAEVQWLVSRGFAVLQPQFRGTQGLGFKHFQAGWRQWGKAMQSDIADAVSWAVEQGFADPKRIAIGGTGYGGYASLMGLIRTPELFRCAVSWAGLTELDTLYASDWEALSREFKKERLPSVLGDRVADAADLRANSPQAHSAAIKRPVLLAHGGADLLVPFASADSFRSALQSSNSVVQWLVYKDEGHDLRSPANRIDFWNRTARFLDEHLAVA